MKLNILIERDEDLWIAQCVEHDLVTQAPSLTQLYPEIWLMLAAHVVACAENDEQPFNIPPAPTEVRERFERATLVVTSTVVIDVDGNLPEINCRIIA